MIISSLHEECECVLLCVRARSSLLRQTAKNDYTCEIFLFLALYIRTMIINLLSMI